MDNESYPSHTESKNQVTDAGLLPKDMRMLLYGYRRYSCFRTGVCFRNSTHLISVN